MLSIIKTIKNDLGLDIIVLKNHPNDTINSNDIDIIICKERFSRLAFNNNYCVLKNRYLCDKHIFFLYYFIDKIFLIDFNIDGLSIRGQIVATLKDIYTNRVECNEDGVYKVHPNILSKYAYYKNNPMKLFFSNFELSDFIKFNLFRYQKLYLKKFTVVFIGVDGCGKSTTIDNIYSAFKIINPVKVYMGWKQFYFKPITFIRSLIHRNSKTNTANTSTRDFIEKRSLAKLLIYYFELYLRYIVNVFNTKTPIILFDRYFYDWLILSKSKIIEKIFLYLTPKPDILFYLTASVDILHERKGETSLKKIRDLKQIYESKHYIQNAIHIDTSDLNSNILHNIIIKEIVKVMNDNMTI